MDEMLLDLDKDMVMAIMLNHIQHTSSKEFLYESDFEAFGKAVFNDILTNIITEAIDGRVTRINK